MAMMQGGRAAGGARSTCHQRMAGSDEHDGLRVMTQQPWPFIHSRAWDLDSHFQTVGFTASAPSAASGAKSS